MKTKNVPDIKPDRPVPFFLKDNDRFLEPIPFPTDHQPSQIETNLRERIKELNCLYGIFRLAERHQSSLNGFLDELAQFLPHAWQYTDVARVKITFQGQVFTSTEFRQSKWRQASQILVNGEAVGECAVYYIEQRPSADEGPFLKEERVLLNTVAEQIGNLASRIGADEELLEINRQLKLERQALQETNTALKIVLSRQETARQEIYRDIGSNVDKILMPILMSLETQLQPSQKGYAQLLSANLKEIASPFTAGLTQTCDCLSPTEISISNMIKHGMTTKQIASLRGVSPATINRHRENIRRKLKITNQDVNMVSFLQSYLKPEI